VFAAAAVLDAIKAGQLSHIFLVGGCDAPEPSRKYYTDVVKGLPQDTMVLTLGCGKYRFYDQDLGTLANGLPRLLDMGQVRAAIASRFVAVAFCGRHWSVYVWVQMCFIMCLAVAASSGLKASGAAVALLQSVRHRMLPVVTNQRGYTICVRLHGCVLTCPSAAAAACSAMTPTQRWWLPLSWLRH
jgi:hypothetical protein